MSVAIDAVDKLFTHDGTAAELTTVVPVVVEPEDVVVDVPVNDETEPTVKKKAEGAARAGQRPEQMEPPGMRLRRWTW